MKISRLVLGFALLFIAASAVAQKDYVRANIDNFRLPGQQGLNVFEAPLEDSIPFNGLRVRVGGDFAMQFQSLSHSNSFAGDTLVALGSNFNLPTANLNIDVQMHRGVRLHLRTYLSSRHHPEAWVKGGHLSINRLDFIREGFLDNVMDHVTVRIGLDEINYGDYHFRRTDNAMGMYNPFVGNYILDGFTTEAFGEIYYRNNGFLIMGAISNGKLNQSVVNPSEDTENTPSFYGKIGYDKQLDSDLRVRLTASGYANTGDQTIFLYNGDRASSRYYNVMDNTAGEGDDWSGRLRLTVPEVTSFMINPFVKFKGLEFFGTYEIVNTVEFSGMDATYNQLAADLIYRFGSREQLYFGGRYNSVVGGDAAEGEDINRINIGGGWFLTENIMAKLEYVTQSYEGDGWAGSRFEGGEFDGIMLEALISF